jgi:hypothetical protein
MSTPREDSDAVLVALLKASILMRLPSETIGAVLQTSLQQLYLMRSGEEFLELHIQAYERAKCFVRMWHQLVRASGSDSEAACAWMHAPCREFGGRRPSEVLADRDGLYQVADYARSRDAAGELARECPPQAGE